MIVIFIKFMMDDLVDKNLIYKTEQKENENFGDVTVETQLHKEYSENIIKDIQSTISGFNQYEYQGCKDRIGKEVYKLYINDNEYYVSFIFDKRSEIIIQLNIEIKSVNIEHEKITERYDKYLEILKIGLKNRLIKDWKLCTWLIDEQSEMLCSNLYPRFFKIENQVRTFTNKVLIYHLGQNWIKLPGFEKYNDSVSNLEIQFKQIVPAFANINTTLLSMTLETLANVMLKAVVYDENTTLTSSDIVKIYDHLKKQNIFAAKDLIQNRRKTKVIVWDGFFIQYIDKPEDFKMQLNQFIKNRNHIAHNKLLSISAFNQIVIDTDAFDSIIVNAINSFEEKNASEELIDTWMYEQEQEQEENDPDYEKNYWRYRIGTEANIEIRNEDGIYDMFYDTIVDFYDKIYDKYHFDSCYNVSDLETPANSGKSTVFNIKSNASENEVEIVVEMTIDDEMDSTSNMIVTAFVDDNIVSKSECAYYNGSGHEGDEGFCVGDVDSEYDDTEIEEFVETVIDYIDNKLNPYINELSSLEYEAVRHGGPEPVAEFACQECGNNGVSILDDFYPVGKCCYCGYENEYYTCEICGTIYDDFGGDGHFCNGCLPKDKDLYDL